MRTEDFDYPLPDELIAQAPAEPRDSCRLLVLNREDGSVEHRRFFDILDYLEPGDLLIANKTRVMPARLVGKKRGTGGVCETLLLKRREDVDAWVASGSVSSTPESACASPARSSSTVPAVCTPRSLPPSC